MTDVTIEKICQFEPKVLPIIEEARKARVGVADGSDNIWVHYSFLKSELSKLVGWNRPGAGPLGGNWLCSQEAYNVAIRALSDALGV